MSSNKDLVLKQILSRDLNMFFLIAGPCAIEGEEMAFEIANELKRITSKLNIPFIFKGSYRKANRSRLDSFTGIGDERALQILSKVGKELEIPTTTDIHTAEEAAIAAIYVDVLQIPAFLCRQTDILVAAAKTNKIVNVKKGQFLKSDAMIFAIEKVRQSGNQKVIATDRGTMFGYGDLIVDYRSIPTMQNFKVPVVMDCTHALQQPNTTSGVTGGRPEMISTIAKAAIAVGANGLFIETHPKPSIAKSDGANMLQLDQIQSLLSQLTKIYKVVH